MLYRADSDGYITVPASVFGINPGDELDIPDTREDGIISADGIEVLESILDSFIDFNLDFAESSFQLVSTKILKQMAEDLVYVSNQISLPSDDESEIVVKYNDVPIDTTDDIEDAIDAYIANSTEENKCNLFDIIRRQYDKQVGIVNN